MSLVAAVVLSVSSVSMMVAEPLMLGLLLLINALWVAVMVGATVSSLLGFFIFLVYVGGMMVVFSYVVSLVPNQLFSYPRFPVLGWLSVCFVGGMVNMGATSLSGYISYGVLSYKGGVAVYLFMGVLLLLVMLVVVSLCFKERLPLRATG